MTASDRHEVICAIAADLYNENGSMEDAKLSPADVQEIVARYQGTETHYGCTVHVRKLLDIRMPTEEEIRIALFQVMGAQEGMTTVLVLNLEGEDVLHSVWLIDQDITQELAQLAFSGSGIWQQYPALTEQFGDSDKFDDQVIQAVLKDHGWTGRKVSSVEGWV